jgi:hypothetical protein
VERVTVAFQAPINARVEIRSNGEPVPANLLGRVTNDPKRGVAYYEFIGVPLRVGPNKIQISALLDGGIELTDEVSISLVASPSRCFCRRRPRSAPADGKGEVVVTAEVRDEFGIPSSTEPPSRSWRRPGNGRPPTRTRLASGSGAHGRRCRHRAAALVARRLGNGARGRGGGRGGHPG